MAELVPEKAAVVPSKVKAPTCRLAPSNRVKVPPVGSAVLESAMRARVPPAAATEYRPSWAAVSRAMKITVPWRTVGAVARSSKSWNLLPPPGAVVSKLTSFRNALV